MLSLFFWVVRLRWSPTDSNERRVRRKAVRRYLNFYSRAIEKNCYSNDLENIDIYLAGICSLVRNSFYISAEITLYAVSNQVG